MCLLVFWKNLFCGGEEEWEGGKVERVGQVLGGEVLDQGQGSGGGEEGQMREIENSNWGGNVGGVNSVLLLFV